MAARILTALALTLPLAAGFVGRPMSPARLGVRGSSKSSLRMAASPTEVVIIGCGCPKRGMGWFHALQMLNGECPSAKLTHVVEPWFLGAGADGPGGPEFGEFRDEWAPTGVGFCASLADLPPPTAGASRMALIAGRTADNPKLLRAVIDECGCDAVVLEKPGAPSVGELEGMRDFAKSKDVPVFMGFNKNIARYVEQARAAEAGAGAGASTKFVSLNAYKEDELEECFERNAEGMLKNMAIHELALAATFYDCTVDTLASVDVEASNSRSLTLGGRTDFAKLDFTLTTTAGRSVRIFADRCGGNGCEAIVSDAAGAEVFRSALPDDEIAAEMAANEAAHPDWMPYFFLQERDYRNLKERCAAHIASGAESTPAGIATIDIAIEALKLAEHLTPILQQRCEDAIASGAIADAIAAETTGATAASSAGSKKVVQ